MENLGSSMMLTTLLQLAWFIIPAIGLAVGIYANNNFKSTASSGILIRLIIQLMMTFVQIGLSFSLFNFSDTFDISTIYLGIGGILFRCGVLQLLKRIKAGAFNQGTANKGNGSATNVHFYSLGAFVYQRGFCPLIPLPRCRRQRARCFLKLESLTVFSLLKLKRTFVYTVTNHFFNKWWCTFATVPRK
ncbi:MAG: hypothetical protein ACI87N_002844 [Flavobacteriales bacterium]|jgi:hypothetical protein